MKRRCVYCGEKFDEEVGYECPHCHQDTRFDNLDKEGIHKLHQTCHKNINKNNDIKNNALTFIVVGNLLLIIGLIFFFLSFKKDIIGVRNFTPGCTEFFLSVICLGISLVLLTIGIISLVKALKELKLMKKIIKETNR